MTLDTEDDLGFLFITVFGDEAEDTVHVYVTRATALRQTPRSLKRWEFHLLGRTWLSALALWLDATFTLGDIWR